MRNILIIVAVIGVAVAGAYGVMAIPAGPSAHGCGLHLVNPAGTQYDASLSAGISGLNGAILLAQDEEEATEATEGEEPEEETLGPGVDRQWDIVMSA